jgi:threonine dehydrogenase-like Zn-dependent dehydrogenase
VIRAAVMPEPGRIEVRRFPRPAVEPGAILLRIAYSGVCGTDKHTFRGETKQYAGTPHERDLTFPLICGHENVGTIEEIGGTGELIDAEGNVLRVGDRIVPGANVPCGRCWFCRSGHPYYACEHLDDYGNSLHCGEAPYLFGGWSEYLYLKPGTPVFRVPDDLPSRVAVLTEIMAVTHGLDVAASIGTPGKGFRYGDTVVVLGVGPVGLCHVIKARLGLAQEFGASLSLNAAQTTEEERIEAIRAATGGRGADVVIDCTGIPQGFVEALRLVRFGGTVLEPGAFVDLGPVPVNPNADICVRDICVLGVGGETASAYGPAMKVMARNLDRFPFERIVSHEMPLERAQEAVTLSETDAAMKVVMAPHGAAA